MADTPPVQTPTETPGYVPVSVVMDHIQELLALGMNQRQIAQRAGVAHNRVHFIVNGKVKGLHAKTAQALLAVKYQPTYSDDERHPVAVTRRRAGALMRIGWPVTVIAAEAGITQATLNQIMNAKDRKWITAAAALGIEVAYEKLSRTPGGRKQAMLIARRAGYAPPQAYRPGEIEDPEPTRTKLVFTRWQKDNPPPPGELFADLIEKNDYTLAEFADRLDIEVEVVRGWIAERHRPRSGLYRRACELLHVAQLPILPVQAPPRGKRGETAEPSGAEQA